MKAQYGSKKKYHFLYKTTNLINGKFYYGMHSTNDLQDGYLGSGTLLKRSINKHGAKNFHIKVLEFFDTREALVEAEKKLITNNQVEDSDCMNLKPGGRGGFMNEEHAKNFHAAGGRKVRQLINEKRKQDLGYRETWIVNMSKAQTKRFESQPGTFVGKKHTEESKAKTRLTREEKGLNKPENNSQFGTKWITNEGENKKIKATEEIPEGWRAGRKIKLNP
jgi:hypothetical protein